MHRLTTSTLTVIYALTFIAAPFAAAAQAVDGYQCVGYRPGPLNERPTRAWTQCEVDSDCVLSKSMCDWPETVAKPYLEAQQKHAACSVPYISCAYAPIPPGPHRAVCENKRCQALPIED
ncbi:MAG: hypothetical protein KI792_13610 [Alphaproteobacteria bacterium]|nr:hypothetical protein [Alphaproteobacteria bacterium SS10]